MCQLIVHLLINYLVCKILKMEINILPKCQHHALDTLLAEFALQSSGFFAKTQLADSQVCSAASFGADPVPSKTGPVSPILILILLIKTADVLSRRRWQYLVEWKNSRVPSAFSLLWPLMASVVSSRSGVSLTWWFRWVTLWHNNRAERGEEDEEEEECGKQDTKGAVFAHGFSLMKGGKMATERRGGAELLGYSPTLCPIW